MTRIGVIYVATCLLSTVITDGAFDKFTGYDYLSLGTPKIVQYDSDNQYIHQIHSMIDAYRGERQNNIRTVIETNALINTKYRTWKRNADFINSLLALPKGMNEAGRR